MRGNADLILVGLVALVGVATAVGPPGPLRVVLGLTLCLLLPGYALSAALYAKVDDLRWAERIALSVGTSLVLLVLTALAVSFSPWSHDPHTVALALGGVTVLSALAAWLHRVSAGSDGPCARWGSLGRVPVPHLVMFMLAAIAILGTGVSWLGRSTPSEAFTTFSVLRRDGVSGPYLMAGREIPVILGVTNHEGHRMSYRIEVLQEHSVIATIRATVATGATWRHPMHIVSRRTGHTHFRMLLFRGDWSHLVYRRLLLRVTRP